MIEDFIEESNLRDEISSIKAFKYSTAAYDGGEQIADHVITGMKNIFIDKESTGETVAARLRDRIQDYHMHDFLRLGAYKSAKLLSDPEFRQDFFQDINNNDTKNLADRMVLNTAGVRASVANLRSIVGQHEEQDFFDHFSSYGDSAREDIARKSAQARNPEEVRRIIKEEAVDQAYNALSDAVKDKTEYGEDVIKEALRNSEFSNHIDRVLDERMKEYPDPNGPDADKFEDWNYDTAYYSYSPRVIASAVKGADLNPDTYLTAERFNDHQINDRNMELMSRKVGDFLDDVRQHGRVFGDSRKERTVFSDVVIRRVLSETRKELDGIENRIRNHPFDDSEYY